MRSGKWRLPRGSSAEDHLELARVALRTGVCLEFVHDGCFRRVEVHTLGLTTAGRLAICAFQVDGETNSTPIPDWRLFCLEDCSSMALADLPSHAPRPGYRRGSKQFSHIGAEI